MRRICWTVSNAEPMNERSWEVLNEDGTFNIASVVPISRSESLDPYVVSFLVGFVCSPRFRKRWTIPNGTSTTVSSSHGLSAGSALNESIFSNLA